ncbi:C-type lectin domain family 2 member D11-like [Sorex fumeus]|uniref:C-type lectin domain family 2 member D11-like n=1 Tax=Sorex fumeus TaxID=62283 RepID=UPI0024ACCF7D|nr:C-type lectin domain family 2 member D11-like [Sorex fumeus]
MVVEDSSKEMQEHSVCLEYNNCLPFSGKEQFGTHNQEKYRTTRSSETLHRHALCIFSALIMVISIVTLSVTLTVRKEKTISEVHVHFTCPPMWIGFGKKCFYFSEETGNWTFSQTFCDLLEANLVQIDTKDELEVLRRYKGPHDHWIGLSRESPSHSWKWTNNAGGNIVFQVRGTGECAYLNDKGVSSGRIYSDKKWICSKTNVSTCKII